MNDRVLSGNFHAHIYINTNSFLLLLHSDPSVPSRPAADPPPSQKPSILLPSFTLLRRRRVPTAEQCVVPLPKHHLRSLPSSLTLLYSSSFPCDLRRTHGKLRRRCSDMFPSPTFGLHFVSLKHGFPSFCSSSFRSSLHLRRSFDFSGGGLCLELR